MTEHTAEEVKEKIEYQAIAEFLESTPPNQLIHISDLSKWEGDHFGKNHNVLKTPEIQLHCDHENCNGMRFFRCISGAGKHLYKQNFYDLFYLTYRCSNCQKVDKIFSLAANLDANSKPQGECFKFGELPPFGPPVPPRLIKLIGPDRDEFLKGRRCENQGLGVGAFIYYRRVVENQKNRIIEEIVKVSEKIGAPKKKIETLRAAIEETQFSKALNMAKDSLPETLLINGYSPLSLLHRALSEGVHALTDEKCL